MSVRSLSARRGLLALAGLGALLAAMPPARAHGSSVGALRVEHAYALPTPPGARTGAAYLRAIINRADQPDQLIGASTRVAAAVEFHHSEIDAQHIARMRQHEQLDIPARGALALRHDGAWHLMLTGLKSPLKAGERFPLTLRFARAGELVVTVWVQQPREAAQAEHSH